MGKKYRIITSNGLRYTIEDDAHDAVTFVSNRFYKSATSGIAFLVVDEGLINLNQIVSIEAL